MIETKRLRIYTATQREMEKIIQTETDEILKMAYQEMLDGCLMHPKQWEWYAIWQIDLKDGTHIGDLCFKGIGDNASTEIGYGISDGFRRQGFATEAVNALVNWALSQPCIQCVEAEAEENNIGSQRVLEKCGFTRTGIIGEEGPRFARKK